MSALYYKGENINTAPITPVVSITKAEYNANKTYYDGLDSIIEITDSTTNGGDASNVVYRDSNVQAALDSNINKINSNPFSQDDKEYIICNGKSCVHINYRDFAFSGGYDKSVFARKIPDGIFFPARTQTSTYFAVGVDVWYDLSKYSKFGYDITIGDTRYTEEIDIADKNTRYIVLFDYLTADTTVGHVFEIHTSTATSFSSRVILKKFTNINNKSVLVNSLYLVV